MKSQSNVIALLAAGLLAACAASPRVSSGVGYPSVAVALQDLRSKPGVTLRNEAGWTVVTDRNTYTIWSFAPESHPVYPAVAKRSTFEKDGAVYVDLKVLCEAEKAACDALVEEFQRLNRRAAETMQRGLSQ